MKVILLQDVAKIGRRGEIADVPNGYAMNQLIPAKKAAPATGANLKKAQANQAAVAAGAADLASAFEVAKAALVTGPVTITATMNEQDHMFEAVSAESVVEAAKAAGTTITTQMVKFAEPIKSAGDHEVTLVSGDHSATFTITVTKA
jgi:large subunit ribosomal protein L9